MRLKRCCLHPAAAQDAALFTVSSLLGKQRFEELDLFIAGNDVRSLFPPLALRVLCSVSFRSLLKRYRCRCYRSAGSLQEQLRAAEIWEPNDNTTT